MIVAVWTRVFSPPISSASPGNSACPENFFAGGSLDWLGGGPPPDTTLEDNLQSTAMLCAAIRASEPRITIDVQALARALAS